MEQDLNKYEIEILESEEFNSLLDAVHMMAKAQGNLSHLTKAVSELKDLVDSGSDKLPLINESMIVDVVESMQELVDDLTSDDSVLTRR